jgi:hypothetical protein
MPRTSKNPNPPKRSRGGRPPALSLIFDPATESTVADQLIEEIRGGEYLETACAYVGISAETAREALRTAQRVRLAHLGTEPDPTTLTPYEGLCLRFSVAYKKARAEYEREVLGIVDTIARGGGTVRTIRRKRRFLNSEDEEGWVVEQTETVKELPPDLQAIVYRLAHIDPARFAPKLHLIETKEPALDDDEHASELQAGIAGYLAGLDDAKKAER